MQLAFVHSPMTSVRSTRLAARALALACASFAVLAPARSGAQQQLDPVAVTGTREPQPLSRTVSDVVVIDARTIRGSTADSIEDLLRREAGLQIARNGGPGQSAGFFLRGAGTSGTLVLVDGVRIASPTLGQAQFESLSLAQVERIEVLRGPASSLYGADATGGVVLVTTRRGSGPLRVDGSVAVGGERSVSADAGISGAAAGVDYALSAGREQSRGVSALRPDDAFGNFNPDTDGYRRTFAQARLGWAPVDGHRFGASVVRTRLNARYDASEFAPPTFAPDPSPDFRNRLDTTVATVDWRGALTRHWTSSVLLGRHVDDARTGGNEIARYVAKRWQATWQNALQLGPDHRVVLAYDRLVERVGGDVDAAGHSRHNDGFVLGWTGTFGATTVQADARRDVSSVYGGDTTGRFGIAQALGGGFRLRALAGTSFRAPTFNDLYYPDYGVDTVRPERGRSVEVGLAWAGASTDLAATLWRNRVRDLIGYQADPTQCPSGFSFGCAGNTANARLQGATLSAAQRWGGFALRAQVDLLDATDAATGERLPRRAAHQETLGVDWTGGDWSAGASSTTVGSRPDFGVRLGGYTVVDLKAGWRFAPTWRLEAKLLNAGDRSVEPVRDYQGLGRQAWLVLRHDGRGL